MEPIKEALQLKTELEQLRPIGKEQEAVIMQKFRLDWNYHSNHLEGNSLTFGETKALILHGITAQGKPLKDHIEITGHDKAIQWVTDVVKGNYPFTETFIRELHTLLLKEPYEVDAITPDGQHTKKRVEVGKYKTLPNHVLTRTGEIFRFATPEETPALMHDLMEWYQEKAGLPDINSIILAAEFHYKFIRIHLFDDGNGRVARILMNFILIRFGYPPVIIKTEDKANYFSALQQADAGMIEPFINYIAKNLVRSLEIMIAGAKGESIEEPDDLDKEIALLEQKVKTVGKKVEILKTKEAILEIYDDSIARTCQQFITACEKFDRFYVSHSFRIYIDRGGNNQDKYNAISENRNRIKQDTNHAVLIYNFNSFIQADFGEFNHASQISIQFSLSKYKLILQDALETTEIEKSYGEQLSDKEINSIVKQAAQQHKELIERKIKEAQDKKE